MKAVVLKEHGNKDKFCIEDVPSPKPGVNDVLIRVRIAALNRRDIFIRKGQYPGIKLPAILGSDGAGDVIAKGDNVKGIEIGQSVMINPALNWGRDINVYGKDFSIVGMPTDGTLAQYIKVRQENVFLKPEYLSWEEAAAIPLAGLTAYRAMITRGKVTKGENVVIPGIGGGVATFLLQIAVATKAKTYVTSSSYEKIEKAITLGATAGVCYTEYRWDKKLREVMKSGADLSVDSIGGKPFENLLNLAKHGSRIVTFGATAGPIPNLTLQKIFLKQIDILGTTMGSPMEFKEMLQFFNENQIKPVIDRVYKLEQIIDAQARLESGKNFGKVLIKIS